MNRKGWIWEEFEAVFYFLLDRPEELLLVVLDELFFFFDLLEKRGLFDAVDPSSESLAGAFAFLLEDDWLLLLFLLLDDLFFDAAPFGAPR